MSELRKVEFITDWRNPDNKTIGKFHCWGSELWEQEAGDLTFTVGLVETLDGKMHKVSVEWITFID